MSCYSVRLLKFTTNACFNLLPHCSGIQDKLPALFLWVVSLGKSVRVYKIHSIRFMLCLFLGERKVFCVLTESLLHINKLVLKFTTCQVLFVEIGMQGPAIKSEMIQQTCTSAGVDADCQKPGGFQTVKLVSFSSLGHLSPVTTTRWTPHRNLSGCKSGCAQAQCTGLLFFWVFLVKLFVCFFPDLSGHSCGGACE